MKNCFLVFGLLLAGAVAAQPEMTLSERPYGTDTYHGDALIGIDAAGRFLIALDVDADGLADHCFLYTATRRLPDGPWSERLTGVTVHHRVADGWASLTLTALQPALVVQLALAGAPLEFAGAAERSIVYDHGWELVRVRPPADGAGSALAAMDHADLSSWPNSFWYDLLDPASATRCVLGNDSDCDAGGMNASQCSLVSSAEGPCEREGACSVTCASWPRNFACCGCKRFDTGGFFPDHGTRVACRCRPCLQMSEADPRPGRPPSDPR